MKKNIFEFFRRGFIACGLGPIVLAVLYLILQSTGTVNVLTVNEVCLGIFTLSALAFIAGGMNVIYQIERLPLASAILIHGTVLYLSYLCTYIINGWLRSGLTPVLVFTAVFVLGYLFVWAIIYCVTRKNTRKINEKLKHKQQSGND
ncbi:MAG: DUF3021 domain-containing protein [Clostridia bacterium]|nr:DUF3021 domain-containing protein [Clostridia bacterium]